MSVLSGAVTFARFRSELAGRPPSDTRRWLAKALATGAFRPLDPRRGDEDRAAGFVELEDHEATGFAPAALLQGEYALFGYRIDTIKVPAALVRAGLDRWTAAFVKQHGRAPSRAEKAQGRAAVRDDLRQRAVPGTRVHDVSWNLTTGQVQIWAASRKAVEEVAAALTAAFAVKLQPLTPGARATVAGIADEALTPTPELVGARISGSEVDRGQA